MCVCVCLSFSLLVVEKQESQKGYEQTQREIIKYDEI